MAIASDERRVLQLAPNHAEFKQKLTALSLTSDLGNLDAAVLRVAESWFGLAREHLAEMKNFDSNTSPRAMYSRAYYAAYSASKCVRYFYRGAVSLSGDDHRKVADLPDSFPSVDTWARDLQAMYEHRLRADYDNWSGTASENTLTAQSCAQLAEKFLSECEGFLATEYGVKL